MKTPILILFLNILFAACQNKIEVDYIVYNANIYTIDAAFSKKMQWQLKMERWWPLGTVTIYLIFMMHLKKLI
jgi:hypothetical protein